jgi:hypothetical protein
MSEWEQEMRDALSKLRPKKGPMTWEEFNRRLIPPKPQEKEEDLPDLREQKQWM